MSLQRTYSENKLRLKRGYVERSEENTSGEITSSNHQHSQEEDHNVIKRVKSDNACRHENENDSILDFKSPESSKTGEKKSAKFAKISTVTIQRKGGNANTKTLTNTKKKAKQSAFSKKKLNNAQSSIESSFFKLKAEDESNDSSESSYDVKTALLCPLCFKTCKDSDSQAVHMKICALRNNVSTETLLNAIDLQKKQEDERKSLGLLAAPVVQEKKKTLSRKLNCYEESDLELALALSRSLQEAEGTNDLCEIDVMAGDCLTDSTEPVYDSRLEKFGFATSKPVAVGRSKRRKHIEPTLLQTRSQADRDRILTEKIAEILMGTESVTQTLQENESAKITESNFVLKRCFLWEHRCTDGTLWDRTSLTQNQNCFFVAELSNHITPRKILTSPLTVDKTTAESVDSHTESNMKLPSSKAKKDELKDLYGTQKASCLKSLSNSENSGHKKYTNTLIMDWGNALNDSAASDMIIFVNNNKYIWAHKLVFYVRCPNILLDVTVSDDPKFATIKEKICWGDVSYQDALAFLEFIYCGEIKKNNCVFEDDNKLSNIRQLARKYKMKQLFDYLQEKEISVEINLKVVNNVDTKEIVAEKSNLEVTKADPRLTQRNIEAESPAKESAASGTENISTTENACYDLEITCLNTVISPARDELYKQQMIDIKSPKRKSVEGKTLMDKTAIHRSLTPDMFDELDDARNNTGKFANRTIDSEEMEKSEVFDLHLANCADSVEQAHNQLRDVKDTIDITDSPEIVRRCSNKIERTTCSQKLLSRDSENSPECMLDPADVDIADAWNDTLIMDDIDIEFEQQSVRTMGDNEKTPKEHNINSDKSTLCNVSVNSGTPKSSRLHESREHMIRQKSNLSIFIEQFRKANADSDLDVNSETEPQIPVKRNRNPFNTNVLDNSEKMSDNLNSTVAEKLENGKTGLDAFDGTIPSSTFDEICDVTNEISSPSRTDANTVEQTLCNTTISSHVQATTDNSELSEAEVNEEISMYARYKRKNKNNSIDNYRARIFLSQKSFRKDSPSKSNAEKMNENHIVKDKTEGKCVTILSDSENGDDSPRNSSKLERNNETLEKSVLDTSNRSDRRTCSQGDIHGEDDISHIRLPTNSLNNSDIEPDKGVATALHKNLSTLHSCDTVGKRKRMDNTSKLRYSKSDSNIRLNRLSLCVSPLHMGENRRETVSPVLISSSPELDMNELSLRIQNKRNPNVSEFEDIDHILENDIHLANVHFRTINSTFKEFNEPERRRSTNDHAQENEAFDNVKHSENKDKHFDRSHKLRTEVQQKEMQINDDISIRKLQRRSVSEGNFGLKAKNVANNSSELNKNDESCKCGQRKIFKGLSFSKPVINRDDVSPLPNYERMSTPELHDELKKYGLKLQKRVRAVKLLTYIYNELHPVAPAEERAVINMEQTDSDNEDLMKQSSQDGDTWDYRNEFPCSQAGNDQSPVHIIAEEMQFEEPECAGTTDGSVTIKEKILKLLKLNKDLHNKVLTYEPLCIESLHSMLKAEGFKCNKNALMDFLDEQCITFYVQDGNRNRTKKR